MITKNYSLLTNIVGHTYLNDDTTLDTLNRT